MSKASSHLSLGAALALVVATLWSDRALRATAEEKLLDVQLSALLDDPCYRYRHALTPVLPIPCSDPDALNGASTVVVSGLLTRAFEVAVFRPCGTQDAWWVHADPCIKNGEMLAVLVGPQVGIERPSRTIFVVLRGVLSRPSHCGHLGAYERLLLIREVLEARLPTTRDGSPSNPARLTPACSGLATLAADARR